MKGRAGGRRSLSSPPAAEPAVEQDCFPVIGGTLEYAQSEGISFPDALTRNLKVARVGPQRAMLCASRRAEAREALAFAEDTITATEDALERGDGFTDWVLGLREAHWRCTGLANALEILEANSRACGETSKEVMGDYQELILVSGNLEWRLVRLAERWRETEGSGAQPWAPGKLASMILGPLGSLLRSGANLFSDTGAEQKPARGRGPGDVDADAGGPGGADAGAGGGARSASGDKAQEDGLGNWFSTFTLPGIDWNKSEPSARPQT